MGLLRWSASEGHYESRLASMTANAVAGWLCPSGFGQWVTGRVVHFEMPSMLPQRGLIRHNRPRVAEKNDKC